MRLFVITEPSVHFVRGYLAMKLWCVRTLSTKDARWEGCLCSRVLQVPVGPFCYQNIYDVFIQPVRHHTARIHHDRDIQKGIAYATA